MGEIHPLISLDDRSRIPSRSPESRCLTFPEKIPLKRVDDPHQLCYKEIMRTTLKILFCILCLASPAAATSIYDNGTPDLAGSWPSDFSFQDQAADNFVLSPESTVISGVNWWGIYVPNNSAWPADFAIRIFEDDGNKPAVYPIYETIVDGGIGPIATGDLVDGGWDLYAYSAPIAPVTLSAGVSYWLSIVDRKAEPGSWNWATSSLSGGSRKRDLDGEPWNTPMSREFAFNLEGQPIPEPATIALFTLGLIALAGIRKKL
jgi:hypothetical protein